MPTYILHPKMAIMKLIFTKLSIVFSMLLIGSTAFAQQDWPKTIRGNGGDIIKIYQPQAESLTGNVLKSRSAVSIIENGKTEPVFGAFWSEAVVDNGNNNVVIRSIQITNIKFPDAVDASTVNDIKEKLQSEIPAMNISIAKDELQQSINNNQAQTKLSSTFNNAPPKVIYTTRPSMLVLIDGAPKLQANSDWGFDVVVNSPFTIVKNNDGNFYLYGGKKWFVAPAATGPYNYVSDAPDNLQKVEDAINSKKDNSDNNDNNTQAANTNNSNVIPSIIVSTEPAELIQSDGEANFSPVENTGLLYVKNSGNDIFMDVNSQQYYVLLSGRWYKSNALNSKWQYTAADKLPADFSKIPAGSPKDNVLASVAGTEEANDALMDAQVPQTAKVDRKTATANVVYDGDPEFERIEGTRLKYAVNASITVMKLDNMYYAVDNGIWFESDRATGPWQVSTSRPDEVDRIPPSSPAYNTKYVYVYDVTPDYVYMGYTPGYLNTYVYGPTIVYGTGYYYRPWFGHRYFARPYTWGFCMNYDPWYGWGIGYNTFGYDWFGFGSYWGSGYRYGGWWGPSVYRPPYCGGYYRGGYGGYYGYNRGGYGYRNSVNINRNYTNNIYYNRRNVVSNDNRRNYGNNNRYNNDNRGGYSNNNRGRWDRNNNVNNNNNRQPNDRNGNSRFPRNENGSNFGRGPVIQNGRDNNGFNNNNRQPDNNSINRNRGPVTQNPDINNGNFGRRPTVQNQDNNNRFNNQNSPPVRQREYNPQRNSNNERNFSRPQTIERPQQRAPQQSQRSFSPPQNNGGGGRGNGSGERSGGGSRPSNGSGNHGRRG
jgi:hypothetical protein